jgi:hypothetical protein
MTTGDASAAAAGPWLPTQLRHMTDNEIRAYARNAGLTPDEAAPWADALIGSFETGRALRDGRSLDDVCAARSERERLNGWIDRGFTAEAAAPWLELGWKPGLAAPWATAGVPIDIATEWAPPGSSRQRLTVAEFTRHAAAGRTPADLSADRRRAVERVPLERRLVWGQWRGWFVVASADGVLDVARRRRQHRRIRSAKTIAALRSAVPVEVLEREVGALLDECWVYEFVPAPGEADIPRRPPEWLPERLPRRLHEDPPHPLDVLARSLPFDASPLRRGDDTGWDCLWRRPYDVVELGELARSHGFVMGHAPRLVDRALGDQR